MALVVADRVKETSLTTGTGALTLDGATTGFNTFSSRCAVGNTCYYALQAVDGDGSPTGDWEVGLGTYSGANTLTRSTVLSSSNGDAAVSLAAGSKQVWITVPALQAGWIPEKLSADRTYYVRADGSNSNDGLSNTAGGAFLTIQKAIDTAALLQANGYNVNITVGAGTYTTPVVMKTVPGAAKVTIAGGAGDQTSTVISTTSADAITSAPGTSGTYRLQYLKLQTTTLGQCLHPISNMIVEFQQINFGVSAAGHIAVEFGALIRAVGAYSISGGAQFHCNGYVASMVDIRSVTVTLTGTPAFSWRFASASTFGVILSSGVTWSGSATGPRYGADNNGVISTGGGGANYFPGNSAGSVATGGQYT